MAEQRQWWVCIRLDACRTRDELVTARSAWSAGWLFRQLHPNVEIISIRSTTPPHQP